jgi:hypothetical protein
MRHQALDASFEQLSATISPTIGVAVATPTDVLSLGQWTTGVAWSTIKVPLAIAALRNNPHRAYELAVEAIAKSDNSAAEQLWSQLGQPAAAAQMVQAILNESGDVETVVECQRLRPGFTPFGQTRWSLSRQAQFAARLPITSGASQVINLMQNLTEAHRWGLAAKGHAAKGGWGPGTDGSYLVRQFATLPTQSGHVGVALAAKAHDGEFDTGKAAINTLADWLIDHLPALTEQ